MLPLVIASIVLNAVSALTCIALFYCYWCIPNRGLGLKLILYLTISDFTFHVSWLLQTWNDTIIQNICFFLFYISFQFSLMWTANLAYFSYKLVRNEDFNKNLKQVKLNALGLLVLSILLAAANQFVGPDSNNWGAAANLLNDATILISLIVTPIFNLMSISYLKKSSAGSSEDSKISIGVLYRYAFVQCFTMGPSAIYSVIVDASNGTVDIPIFYHIAVICIALTGLANAVVYFFQRSMMIRESVIRKDVSLGGHELSVSELTEVFPYT